MPDTAVFGPERFPGRAGLLYSAPMEDLRELVERDGVVIVGGGQAGLQCAVSLRQQGFGGPLTMLSDEPCAPYQRPPLSKAYLKGEMDEERLSLKTPAFFEEEKVELVCSMHASEIDLEARTVECDGRKFSYGALVLATGSRPRRFAVPGADLPGVFDLRTMADVKAIRDAVRSCGRAVVVGAGYIGLEGAAVLRSLGMDVDVVELETRVLARVTGETISTFYQRLHKEKGVTFHLGTGVEAIEGKGRVEAVRLSGGAVLPADMVLVGIGIVPNQELAAEAGLETANGIVVNDEARTSDPHVFAIGDCAERPLARYGRRGRLESVHNAIEQGKIAAAAICGGKVPPLDTPWFWSDQYDVKLQIAGLNHGFDETVLRGSAEEKSFALFYLKDGELIACDAVNRPGEFLMAKRMIAAHAAPSPEALADPSVPIKTIAEEAVALEKKR
jgi:3-phenylpropionate/trans-cinnamate dioxygenase ferredoxin reductase subunit